MAMPMFGPIGMSTAMMGKSRHGGGYTAPRPAPYENYRPGESMEAALSRRRSVFQQQPAPYDGYRPGESMESAVGRQRQWRYAGAQNLPQRPGMPARGATPLKYSAMTGSMLGGPGNTPSVAPGNGRVFVHDNEYNPSPGLVQDVGAFTRQYRSNDAAAGSGPYDGPGALGRFTSLQGQQERPLQMPSAGTTYGGGTRMVQMPDGRMVGMGPKQAQGVLGSTTGPLSPEYQNTLLADAYANQRPGSPGFDQNRIGAMNAAGGHQAYVDGGFRNATPSQLAAGQRQKDHAAGMKEGRRNRAIGRYGLSHLAPTQNYTYDTGAGRGAYVRTGPFTARIGGQQYGASAAGEAAEGFNVATSDFNDAIGAFSTTEDKQSLVRGMHERARTDKEYGKQLQEWINKSEYDAYSDGSPMDGTMDQIAAENEMRRMFGLPPLKPRNPGTADNYPIGGYPMQ